MADIIVADTEYKETSEKYTALAAKIDEYVDDYVKIISEIVTEKCIEGTAAEKLKEFSSLAGHALSGQMTSILSMQARQMNDYISSIDDADEYLY